MSTIDTLRRAEARLREKAGKATGGPWTTQWYEHYVHIYAPNRILSERCPYPYTDAEDEHGWDADYMALMHPPVAVALADWLGAEIEDLAAFLALNPEQADATPLPTTAAALALARAVLREEG